MIKSSWSKKMKTILLSKAIKAMLFLLLLLALSAQSHAKQHDEPPVIQINFKSIFQKQYNIIIKEKQQEQKIIKEKKQEVPYDYNVA